MSIIDEVAFSKPSPAEIPARVAIRAGTKFTVDDENGCHVSGYSTASHGYAQIGWKEGENHFGTLAHRAAWVHATGNQIPAGMTIDHVCKNRRCVNPEHLRLLKNYENARRTSGRDWPLGECLNGHSNEHLALFDGGRRVRCSICYRETQTRYNRKIRKQKTTT